MMDFWLKQLIKISHFGTQIILYLLTQKRERILTLYWIQLTRQYLNPQFNLPDYITQKPPNILSVLTK